MKATTFKTGLIAGTSLLAVLIGVSAAHADMAAADKFLADEIKGLTTLTPEQAKAEMQFFVDAAKPFAGMEINVVSETITTHKYESEVLAPAFTAITGIKVKHDLIQEGDVVEKIQTQMQSGKNIYDGWINDSDLIGTHFRYKQAVDLGDWMANEGKDATLPTLDVDDFIGKSFTTGPDGKMYQLPDQQFANLYWFRYDWFNDAKNMADFKAKYGYDLGVPVNWSAYEDIAEFFTGRDINGQKVFGHMDYGKKDPSLGWRFTDAWLSMAGNGDKGIPNGLPVDEWGIRMEGCNPVGSSVERGGDTNGPASVYAITKYLEWLKKFAPATAQGMTFGEAGPVPAQGNVAQQMFWYTAFTADLVNPETAKAVLNEDGTPKWRMAPSPKGSYWKDGMKLGYQDAGAATLLKSTPVDRRKAAWLYLQFINAKSTSLKKSHVGLTFTRESDIWDKSFTERAPKLGGLIEFYRSPARVQWTPTGNNVPDYPKLAQLWWQNIGDASSEAKTPQEAMDSLAAAQDAVMERLEKSGVQGDCGPKMNKKETAEFWYEKSAKDGNIAPQRKLENEKPQGVTVNYDELIKSWPSTPPKK